MKEKGMKQTTVDQRASEMKKYFGSSMKFSHAMEWLEKKSDVQKSNHANKIASILNAVPELCPSVQQYTAFKKQQKEWNQKKNAHYQTKQAPSDGITWDDIVRRCEELKGVSTFKKMEQSVLCSLVVELSVEDLQVCPLQSIRLQKVGTSRKQNYINKKVELVIWDDNRKKNRTIALSDDIKQRIKHLNKNENKLYLFGCEKELSQPAFSLMWGNVFGTTQTNVRRLKQLQI